MKIKLFPLGIAIVLLVVSCGKYEAGETAQADVAEVNKEFYKVDSTVAGNEQQQGNPPRTQQAAVNPDWDKKIIKTAALSLEVEDYNKYYSLLRESVRNTGGYIAAENQGRTDYKLENIVTVKVPVAQFDEAMTRLTTATGKEKVMELRVSSQDVTGEVVDTKSRMEAKRQVRLRYMELLQQAKNMEDILKVQSEINQVQEQIEMGAGRVNYLNHASAFSTIQLTFYQVLNPSAETPSDPSFSLRPGRLLRKAGISLRILSSGSSPSGHFG